MFELVNELLQNPLNSLFIVASIVLLECLLSVDNAAVLATMVLDLPEKKRKKALRYGILGAFAFRGLALLLASYIVNIWFLKPIGGLYLIYLAYKYFKNKSSEESGGNKSKEESGIYNFIVKHIGIFWATVAMVEVMDIAFSIDNIFAVVAFTKNYALIVFGVCIGILAMRFVAQKFVVLIEKYKSLETAAFVVIGILGVKLLTSLVVHFVPSMKFLESETFDFIMSGLTIVVFIFPLVYAKFKKKN